MKIAIDYFDYKEARYQRIKNVTIWALVTVVLVFSIVFINSCIPEPAYAEEVDMDIIATIESNNNPNAISYRGAKYGRGLCQISEIVLKEFNDLYLRQLNLKEIENNYKEGITGEIIIGNRKLPFKEYDLFDVNINLIIANWYMNTRIVQMLRHYKIKPCADDERHDLYCWKETDLKLIAYNWGIGNLVKWYEGGAKFNKLPKETQNYIKRYHRLEGR